MEFSQSVLQDPKQWTPCKNPKHLRTKHPVDGKAQGQELGVMSTKGMSESVISKDHAKMVRQSPNFDDSITILWGFDGICTN